MNRFTTTICAIIILCASTFSVHASLITLPTIASSQWEFTGIGTLINFGNKDNPDYINTFLLDEPGYVSIVADDCCVDGDAFGLLLDNISTAWTLTDTTNSVFGSGLFHGVFTGFLSAGNHTFSLEVTQDCCGTGLMMWGIALGTTPPELIPTLPVPEPSTYLMLLAGLGLLGFVARKRSMKEESAFLNGERNALIGRP